MKVRVLGCSGAIAKDCRTTSFLVDDDVLIDAGTGVGDLTLAEMKRIGDVFLTHSHLDHIAALPLMIDAVASQSTRPVRIHALAGTLAALKRHVFNDVIWPDFSRLPTTEAPFISFHEVQVGETLRVAGKEIEVLPAVHTVPAVGYAVRTDASWWVYTGDTERNPAFWQRVNQMDVAALVIETAFSNREEAIARRSLHLAPQGLAGELAQIAAGRVYPIFITHTKPAETGLIMSEIQSFDRGPATDPHSAHDIRWLSAGHVFDFQGAAFVS